jgi:hypothetical protein
MASRDRRCSVACRLIDASASGLTASAKRRGMTLSPTSDALARIGRADNHATSLLADHAREHAVRRDIAESALDGLMADLGARPHPDAARFAERLCDPNNRPTVDEALRLVSVAERARALTETNTALREALDAGTFSPLTTPEYERVRSMPGRSVTVSALNSRSHAPTLRRSGRRYNSSSTARLWTLRLTRRRRSMQTTRRKRRCVTYTRSCPRRCRPGRCELDGAVTH